MKPAAKVTLDRLLALLSGRGWLKSTEICELEPRLCPRAIRDLVEHAGGRIISNTTHGYKLMRDATAEEARHAIADLRSRRKKLEAREVATTREWHTELHRRTTPRTDSSVEQMNLL